MGVMRQSGGGQFGRYRQDVYDRYGPDEAKRVENEGYDPRLDPQRESDSFLMQGIFWGAMQGFAEAAQVPKAIGTQILPQETPWGAAGVGPDVAGPSKVVTLGPITEEGIARIEQHLSQFGPDPANQAMIARLKAGGATAQDMAFYMHELHEADLMAQGLDAEAAHLETLKWQGIEYKPGYESNIYHPDVIREYSKRFNPAALPKEQ
jgi:hypothetical protein